MFLHLFTHKYLHSFPSRTLYFPASVHRMCPEFGCGSCIAVRKACYTLTGRDHWGEMHDGILWWLEIFWINIASPNSVDVSMREFVSNHQTCLCSVHWSLLLKPLWIFWLLKHSALPLLTLFRLLAPCWTPLLTQNHHFTFTSISPTITLSMITSFGLRYLSLCNDFSFS